MPGRLRWLVGVCREVDWEVAIKIIVCLSMANPFTWALLAIAFMLGYCSAP